MDVDLAQNVLGWINDKRAAAGQAHLELELACSTAASTEAEAVVQSSSKIAGHTQQQLESVCSTAAVYVSSGITETLTTVVLAVPFSESGSVDRILRCLSEVCSSQADVSSTLESLRATHAGIAHATSAATGATCVVINLLSRHADVLDVAGHTVEAASCHIPAAMLAPGRSGAGGGGADAPAEVSAEGSGEGEADGTSVVEPAAAAVLPSLPVGILLRAGARATGARLYVGGEAALSAPYAPARLLALPLPQGLSAAVGEEGDAGEEEEKKGAEEAAPEPPSMHVALRAPSHGREEGVPVWQDGPDCIAVTGEEGSATVHVPLAAVVADPATAAPSYVLHVLGSTVGAGEGEKGGAEVVIARLALHVGGVGVGVEGSGTASQGGEEEGWGQGLRGGSMSDSQVLGGEGAGSVGAPALPVHVCAEGFTDVSCLVPALAVAQGLGQPLPAAHTPSLMPVHIAGGPGGFTVLPTSECGLAVGVTPDVPRVSHLLLVAGSSHEEAQGACPEGYDCLPVPNLASALGAQLGAGRVEPTHVYLAVTRGSGPPVTHCDLVTLHTSVTVDASSPLPSLTAPEGYALQVLDVAVRVPMPAQEQEGEEKVEEGPRTGISLVRFALLQTCEVSAAQAVADGHASVIVQGEGRAESFIGVEDGRGSDTMMGGDAPFLSLSDMGYGESVREPTEEELEAQKAEMIDLIHAALEEQVGLKDEQRRTGAVIAAWLSKRAPSAEELPAPAAVDVSNVRAAAATAFALADKTRKFTAAVEAFTKERERAEDERQRAEAKALGLQSQADVKEAVLNDIRASFSAFKREVARGALHSQTRKPIPRPLLDKYEEQETLKEDELSRAQLRFLAAQAAVSKLEATIAAKDKLADGLQLMDFEQLKIENAALGEKIEDRTNEINKLRKKTTGAVQVLTHVREKLQFVSAEVTRLSAELQAVDMEVSAQRLSLAQGKKERERMRAENDQARQAQGFAYIDKLAIDYERRKRSVSLQLPLNWTHTLTLVLSTCRFSLAKISWRVCSKITCRKHIRRVRFKQHWTKLREQWLIRHTIATNEDCGTSYSSVILFHV